MKYYVIIRIGREYNDEYYRTLDSDKDQGAPVNVFLDVHKALERKEYLELQAWRSKDIGYYIYGDQRNQCVETEELYQLLKGDIPWNEHNNEIDVFYLRFPPELYTDEELEEIIKCFTVRFYSLYEVTDV